MRYGALDPASVWPDRIREQQGPNPIDVLKDAVAKLNSLEVAYTANITEGLGENGGKSFHLELVGPNVQRIDVASLLVSSTDGYPATVAFGRAGELKRYLKVLDADQLISALRQAVNSAVS